LLEGPPDLAGPLASEVAWRRWNHELDALFGKLLTAARPSLCPFCSLAKQEAAKTRWRVPFTLRPGARWPVRRRSTARFSVTAPAGRATTFFAGSQRISSAAAEGTLFLNEIEELSPEAELALVPMLKSSPRAGANDRVFPAIQPRSEATVPRIRADLLAQLAGFTMPVRPLRERREDLGTMVARSCGAWAAAKRNGIAMNPEWARRCFLHDWPYNVSELDSCVHTAVALSTDGLSTGRQPRFFLREGPLPGDLIEGGSRDSPSNGEGPLDPDPEFGQNVRRALKCNLSVAGLPEDGCYTRTW